MNQATLTGRPILYILWIGRKLNILIPNSRCYKDGKFTQDMTMEQMIDHCAQFTDEINRNSGQNLTVEQMKEQMRQFFPHLKRWKK